MARIYLERHHVGDDLRRWLEHLDAGGAPASECSPPCDVVETADALHMVMDLPGVDPDSVEVVFSNDTLVVAGTKQPPACNPGGAAFHMAERTFGRFARAVRLAGAFDLSRAEASLAAGELQVILPRIEERRGTRIRIPVRAS